MRNGVLTCNRGLLLESRSCIMETGPVGQPSLPSLLATTHGLSIHSSCPILIHASLFLDSVQAVHQQMKSPGCLLRSANQLTSLLLTSDQSAASCTRVRLPTSILMLTALSWTSARRLVMQKLCSARCCSGWTFPSIYGCPTMAWSLGGIRKLAPPQSYHHHH